MKNDEKKKTKKKEKKKGWLGAEWNERREHVENFFFLHTI